MQQSIDAGREEDVWMPQAHLHIGGFLEHFGGSAQDGPPVDVTPPSTEEFVEMNHRAASRAVSKPRPGFAGRGRGSQPRSTTQNAPHSSIV
jgi:hypothetical protein